MKVYGMDRAAADLLMRYGEKPSDIHVTRAEREEISRRAEQIAAEDDSEWVSLFHIYKAIRLWQEENYGETERIAFKQQIHGL